MKPMRLRMGFAAITLAVGFILTRAQHQFGWSDGLVLGLIGATVLGLLMLADRIDGRRPQARS